MSAIQLVFQAAARAKVIVGVNILADVVSNVWLEEAHCHYSQPDFYHGRNVCRVARLRRETGSSD